MSSPERRKHTHSGVRELIMLWDVAALGFGVQTNTQRPISIEAGNAVKEPTPFQSLVVQFAPAEVEHAIRIRSYGLVLHRVLVCMDLY